MLAPAKARAGLPRITFHTFRHTCASLLFEAGRKADAAVTLRTYAHLMDDGAGDAAFMDSAVTPDEAAMAA